ncbi:MAG: hypothetical protein ABS95_02255 [Verrucomicrobia bacterium SCN 57-15]|nr:MAG: hypothetical protein ABS95_02255 [Verrucomicrobia bacterium SCN 57-15]
MRSLNPFPAILFSQLRMNVDVQQRNYIWSVRRSPAFMLAGTLHGLIPAPGASFFFQAIKNESYR